MPLAAPIARGRPGSCSLLKAHHCVWGPFHGVARLYSKGMCVFAGENPGEELLSAMAEACKEKIDDFTSQNLSNALLAFAKLDYKPEDLLETISVVAKKKLDTFTPQVTSRVISPLFHHAWQV
jgi:hypothetical protein